MTEIKVDPSVYKDYPAHIVNIIELQLKEQIPYRRIRARRKWQENVEAGGTRYGVVCHKLNDDLIKINKIKPLAKKGYTHSMKKQARVHK